MMVHVTVLYWILYLHLLKHYQMICNVKLISQRFMCIFEYNQRLYSQGGLAGNDHGFEHSICASRGHAANKRH